MELNKTERSDSVALNLKARINDTKTSLLILRHEYIKANTKRLNTFINGIKTPNSNMISTQHNEARFNNLRLKLIPARMKARPCRSAKSEEYRKAKVAMRYGSKYKTLGVQRQAEYLRILSPANARISLMDRREILGKIKLAIQRYADGQDDAV